METNTVCQAPIRIVPCKKWPIGIRAAKAATMSVIPQMELLAQNLMMEIDILDTMSRVSLSPPEAK